MLMHFHLKGSGQASLCPMAHRWRWILQILYHKTLIFKGKMRITSLEKDIN
jgi:hypothetical protein